MLKNFQIEKTNESNGLIAVTGDMEGEKYVYLINKTSSLERITEEDAVDQMKSEDAFAKMNVTYRTVLIHPAKPKDIAKYFTHRRYLPETWDEYIKSPRITDVPWIDNIFSGGDKEEGESCYYRDDTAVIVDDSKWNKNVDELYLLLIFKDVKYTSIRDLTGKDIEMLEKYRALIYKLLKNEFNLNPEDIVLYFHYQPSHYRLHIHILNISKTTVCLYNCYRSIFLDDVIKNLKLDDEYYRKTVHSLQ